MFYRNTLSAAVLLALSHAALAETTELSPVVVTANRVARTADDTLSAITVITRQDIETRQAQSLEDLLRGLPGIQFSNNGGPGKATNLYLRGGNGDHTLILVDGVKIGSATLGTAPLQDIPLEMIERIEIVRGPRASLYGSEALSGVVQIFTKRGPQSTSLSLGGGSRGTYEGAVNGGFGTANAWLNVGASGFTTRGLNVKDGGSSPEPDRDGYTRSSEQLRGGVRLSEALSLEAQLAHTEARNKYDGNPNVTDVQQDLYASTLRYTPSDAYASTLRLSQNLDASRNLKDEVFSSRIDTRRSALSWQHELNLTANQQVVSGIDYQYDKVISNTQYDRNTRSNKALFTEYLAKFGAVDLQASARHDKNEQFGHHNTGGLAAGYTFSPALRVRASTGTAFKAPSFNDLYWPGAGNPSLQPEKSRTSELGASGRSGDFEWQASLFRSRITNLIAWAPISAGSAIWIPSNVSQARIQGLELGATQHWGNTRVAASATYLEPKDHSGSSTDGKDLVRRARRSGRLDVDHPFDTWSLGTSLVGVGKRYDNAANTLKLGGYATIDLRAEYAINADWRLQTRVENALDKRYQTAYGYNQAGVGVFLTLRYQPK